VHVDIEDGTVDGALLLRDGNILFWSDGYKSSERKLRLWNPSTGKTDDPKIELRSKLVGALEMHSGHILAWDDWALRVWDLRSGKQIGEEMRHEGGWLTNAYEMSNGRILSVSNTHQTVQLWEAGKELVRKRDMAAIAMPDSRIVSWNAQGRSWEQPESSFLRVWTPDFGESSVREARVEAFIRNALVLSNRRVLFVGSDGLLRSWDVANGEQAESAAKHDGAVSGVRLTADGRILSWSEDNTLRLWEAHSLRQIGAPMPHEDHINGALAMTNGRILSWTSSTILYLWHGNREMASDVQSISGAIRLPDDQFLWWSRATLHILNSRTGRSTELGTHGESKVVGGLVLRNGHVLTWSEDGMLRLWNLQERRQIGDDMQHGEPAVEAYETPDNAILSWSYDGTMNLWDQSTGKPIGQTMRHGDRMDGALITTTRRVFSWANNGTLKLWISGTGEPVHVVPEMHHVRPVRALETRYGRILTWSADGTLRLWSSINGDPAGTPMAHESKVVGARAMRDGRRIASWSNDGKLRLSDLNDDRQTGPEIDLAAPAIDILEMSDGRILYWSDSELGLWNPTDGENFKFETTGPNFKSEQPHWFLGALEMPNKRILSWSSDGGLRLWDPTTGFVIGPAMRVGAGFVHGAIVASDGMMLSWSDDGGALWRDGVPDGTLFEAACKLFMPSMDHKEIAKRSGVVFSNPPCESPFRVPFNQKALKGTQIE
jgi:WD40 repeat protein